MTAAPTGPGEGGLAGARWAEPDASAPGPRTAAVLSAAGASRRFGSPKALARWRGQSLLAHQVQALLAGGCNPVIVVLGHGAEALVGEVPQDARVVALRHRGWAEGPASGLRAAFAALAALGPWPEALVLASVDQPTEGAVVRALRAAWGPAWPVAVPSHEGRTGHPSLWAAAQRGALMGIHDATEGLRPLMQALRERRLVVPVAHPVAWNLNRPEALAEAQSQLGG